MTKDNEKLREYIRQNEGVVPFVYICPSGYPTIGVGHKLKPGELQKYKGRRITPEEIDALYDKDLETAIGDARSLFPNFDELDENRQIVLVDMAFNLGRERLAAFKKLRTAVLHRNWTEATTNIILSKYYRQVGKRGKRNATNMLEGGLQ